MAGSKKSTEPFTKSEALELLRQSISNPAADFHQDQWESIDSLVNNKNKLLVVQRTGWGKSSVYFISTRAFRDRGFGPTIIISPLLALMRNQIAAAERIGITAVTINSTNTEEWSQTTESILKDEIDTLLISPERLSNEDFVENVLMRIADRIGLFVVDEAHCISDWGHDFRPDYQRITNILKQMPSNMPVLATTATANNRVVNEIEQQLRGIRSIRGKLTRESLVLQNISMPDQVSRLAWLAETIPQLDGTGIVYTSTIRDADLVAEWLRLNGIRAAAYHGSVTHSKFEKSADYRLYLEEQLLSNKIKALVATTALGMGYDKPDLCFVIHYQMPGSVVGYYQQMGRAGRGIAEARGVLLGGSEDQVIQSFFIESAFPDEAHVKEILDLLMYSDHGLSVPEIETSVNMRRTQIDKVVKYLSIQNPSPVIKVGSKYSRTAIPFEMDHEKIDFLTKQRYEEFNQMLEYLNLNQCLMAFLRDTLNDSDISDCGKCAICNPDNALAQVIDPSLGVKAAQFLKRTAVSIAPRKQIPKDALATYGIASRDLKQLLAEEGRVLSKWEDGGWGHTVAKNKHNGHFEDSLVEAMAEMIQQWRPEPFPRWVTCIPSKRHTNLVPDIAKRLAKRLNLPFYDAIEKVKQNQAQKMMQNSFYQCHNLDGVFEITDNRQNGPVLLIDDVVDSGWTFTVAAALLRQSGVSHVFPVALASTANG